MKTEKPEANAHLIKAAPAKWDAQQARDKARAALALAKGES